MTAAQMMAPQKVTDEYHDWRDSTPCGSVDPDLFFDKAAASPAAEAEAKAICGGCQFRQRCLDTAMLNREEWGIWGGMTPDERDAYMSMWERLNGGRGAVRARRENDGILLHNDPSVERRYMARLRAAQECRQRILGSDPFHRRNEYLAVLEMIISHPTEDSGTLARRAGRSKAWLNGMKREAYRMFDVEEIYEGGVA